MMTFHIRTAEPRDVAALAQQRATLWPEGSVEEHAAELQPQLRSPADCTLVAELTGGGRLIGFLEGRLRSHADGCETSPVGYVEGWYVEEDWRGRGVGRALVQRFEEWVRARGCREMASDTWTHNVVSQRAHERLGFEEMDRVVTYRKPLDPDVRLGPHARPPLPQPTPAMRLPPFALERYFARWEFEVAHNLGASDPATLSLKELLALADDECAEWWERLSLGYTESAGAPRLRQAIATLYETVAADDVLTFAGAEEAIFLAIHALLAPGDEVFVVQPSYQSLHEVARSIGARVVALPLDEARGWEFPLDALRRGISKRTRLVVINFPHNPTGALISRAEFDEIVRLCADAGATLFSDEVYRLLEQDASQRLPAAVDCDDSAASLGVMSKAFGLAGLRIGWIATRDARLRTRLAQLKDYTTICSSAPSEVLATIGLRAHEDIVQRIRRILDSNLELLDEFFARNEQHVQWVRPRAGTVALPRLHARDADAFAEELARASGVLVVPGSVFGMSGAHFRLGFGRSDLPVALALLEARLRR